MLLETRQRHPADTQKTIRPNRRKNPALDAVKYVFWLFQNGTKHNLSGWWNHGLLPATNK